MNLILDLFPLLPWIILGVAAGMIVGAVPGLTGAMVIALVVPLTYAMEETSALALLVSLYTGSVSGGLISATLLKIPGTPAAMITILDAHPITESGRPGRALGLGIGASFVGGTLSGIALFFLAKPIAEWSILLGKFDLFALTAMAMVFIISVAEPGRTGLGKGLISGALGCLAALPGMHPATGELRYTFGFAELNDGLSLLPVLIGLFALSQSFLDLVTRPSSNDVSMASKLQDRILLPLREWLGQGFNLVRSSFIGTFIGILPGIGANIGSTIAYGVSRHFSRNPEVFGKGSEEGLVASESANNATVGGALIPLVSLGIPGSVVDAILLGAFIMHGLQPGPLLFQNHPETVESLIGAYLVSNVVMVILMLAMARWIAKLARIDKVRLAPCILVCCVVGAFCIGNRMFDVWVMVGFGLLGLLFQRWKIPPAPFVIGFVLTPVAEENLSGGLMQSGGSYRPLFQSPFSLACLVLGSILLLLSLRKTGQNENSPDAA
ncbi:MAG: tripartite tricarboxylate transporter permease [Verrucomicrobiales bacterium]|nr:tripartite tricarboxylate transporter permease [Verrucomicrobiales bacterium]